MSSRRLLAWVMILVVAGGAWLLSNYLDQRQQDEETKSSRLLDLEDLGAVQSLEFKGRDYPQTLLLERLGQGRQWQVTKPLACAADGMAVGRVLSGLATARVSQRLGDPGPWAAFGLEPPRLELTLTDRQGVARSLLVGEVSPTGESVYLARPGQPEVLLAPAGLRAALAKNLLDLRDKVALDFPLDQVRRVELKNGPQALVLARPDQAPDWTLAGQGPADPQEAENLLLQVHGLLAQGFLDNNFKPAKLGLEPPRGSLTLTLADGSQRGLVWGVEVPGKNQTYVRRAEGGPLMLVQDESLARLERRPHDLLDRRVFTLEHAAVEQVKITRQGREMLYARQEGQWRRLRPAEPPEAGQAAENLLWDLLDLKWEKTLPAGDYGLEAPKLTITLNAAGSASQVLVVGRLDPQSGLVAARRAGQDRVFGIKPVKLGKIPQEPGVAAPASGDQGLSPRK